jgi:hypothetical protein
MIQPALVRSQVDGRRPPRPPHTRQQPKLHAIRSPPLASVAGIKVWGLIPATLRRRFRWGKEPTPVGR